MQSSRLPVLIGALLIAPTLSWAQDTPTDDDAKKKPDAPPVALLNARVDGHERPVTILIARGKIRAVDPRARPLPGMRQYNLDGARVVPGRIDAWASAGSPEPLGNSLDAFDPFNAHAIVDALRGGVTTIVLTPLRSASNSGLAAVLKLKPKATLEERLLVKESAICASLGLGNADAVARAAHADGLRYALEGARGYRDAWTEYDEAVEEYIKELAKVDGKPKPKTPPKPKGPPKSVKMPPRAPGGKPGDPKKKKEDEGPKKPKRPRVSRAKALLGRVLDGELPLRVEAHRAADIVNILELAEEYGFRLILEGASEAYLLADVLAKRGVPVILGPILQSDATRAAFPVRHSPQNAALLDAAGVTVLIGSDAWSGSRFVELNAHLAAGLGFDAAKAEAAITSATADLVGLGDRIGRIAVGYDADLVVQRPGPLGDQQVRAVFIDGELVWRAQ